MVDWCVNPLDTTPYVVIHLYHLSLLNLHKNFGGGSFLPSLLPTQFLSNFPLRDPPPLAWHDSCRGSPGGLEAGTSLAETLREAGTSLAEEAGTLCGIKAGGQG